MKTESVTLLEWQERFGTEGACLGQLIRYRWPAYLPVHGLCASGTGNGGHDFRGYQTAAGEMVLGHIPDGFRHKEASRLCGSRNKLKYRGLRRTGC